MTAQQMLHMLPGLQPDELIMIQSVTKDYSEAQLDQFYMLYVGKRREPQQILIATLVGFFGAAGIQRFITGQIGMGLLYFFTGGLCLIGTVVDLVNHRRIASDWNRQQAFEVEQLMRIMSR